MELWFMAKLYRKISGPGRILPGGGQLGGGVEGAGAGAGGGQGRVSRGGSHILAHRAAQELRGHADWTAGNMGEWSR